MKKKFSFTGITIHALIRKKAEIGLLYVAWCNQYDCFTVTPNSMN